MRLMRTRLGFFYQISTSFLCQDLGKFPPVGLTKSRSHAMLAKSTRPRRLLTRLMQVLHTYSMRILHTIYLEYIQITEWYKTLFYI